MDEETHCLRLMAQAMSEGFAAIRAGASPSAPPQAVYVNPALERMSGRHGRAAAQAMLHKAGLDLVTACERARQAGGPVRFDIADGEAGRWFEARLAPQEAGFVTLLVSDCTAARRQHEVFAELHHRIKNSLANAASLLKLEAAAGRDTLAAERLQRAADRIYAIADLHAVLYRFDGHDAVDLGAYVREFCARLSSSLLESGRVRLRAETDSVVAPFEQAAPLGIILNELVTNAVKHAYGPAGSGEIRVELRRDGTALVLRVIDAGQGLQGAAERPGGLGMRLVRSLVKQLNAELTVQPLNPGAAFEVHMAAPPAPADGLAAEPKRLL